MRRVLIVSAALARVLVAAGGDATRSNVAYGPLADDHVPPLLEAALAAAAPVGDPIVHPVLLGGGLALAVSTAGNVTAWPADGGAGCASAAWQPPPGSTVLAAQAVVASDDGAPATRVVLALQRSGGATETWALVATANATHGVALRAAWGPVLLPGAPRAGYGPLLAPPGAGGAVFTAGNGGLLALDAATGAARTLLNGAAFTCGGAADAPSPPSGPVQLSAAASAVAVGVVTSRGCALAASVPLPLSGGGGASLLWRMERPANFSSGSHGGGVGAPAVAAAAPAASVAAGPPAADLAAGRLYFVTVDGWVCCYGSASAAAAGGGGAPCAGWGGQQCVSLTTAFAAPPPGAATPAAVSLPAAMGLAVSPSTTTFHGGTLYTVDTSGWVYAVLAASGAVGVTAAPLALRLQRQPHAHAGAAAAAAEDEQQRPTPLLVPDGFAPGWNALLVVSPASGVLHALSVGDVGTPTDDDDGGEADDDGAVSTGAVWALALPGAALPGGARVTTPTLSLTGAGRLLVPVGGQVLVVGSARDGGGGDPLVDSPALPYVTLGACAAATLVALVAAVWAASRSRAALGPSLHARALIRAAFIAELGRLQRDERSGAGGGGGGGGEDSTDAASSSSSSGGGGGGGGGARAPPASSLWWGSRWWRATGPGRPAGGGDSAGALEEQLLGADA